MLAHGYRKANERSWFPQIGTLWFLLSFLRSIRRSIKCFLLLQVHYVVAKRGLENELSEVTMRLLSKSKLARLLFPVQVAPSFRPLNVWIVKVFHDYKVFKFCTAFRESWSANSADRNLFVSDVKLILDKKCSERSKDST